jgi:hypothetical protein
MPPELPGPAHDGSGAAEDHVPAIERMCNDTAEAILQMCQELERQKQIVRDLLRHVGEWGICKGPRCMQEILFVYHRDTGKTTPYNPDGTSHFATCPDREQFHRRRRAG